tara:strand:- start:1657 stop:1863 length:207 start_codon:yes stop_codon:yes gene_type:complete
MPKQIIISLDELKKIKLNEKELYLMLNLCEYFIINEISIAEKSKTKLTNLKPIEKLKDRINFLLGKTT